MDTEKPVGEPEGTAPSGPETTAPAPPRPKVTQRELMIAMTIGAVVLLATLGVLMARDMPAKDFAAISERSPARPSSATPAGGAAASAPKWSDANRDLWVSHRKNAVAYEVAADNMVSIWMRTVRPVLVVRCTGGETEVFVVTESATQMEARTEDHTVTLSFDEGSGGETKELWPDSAGQDALFAPDGAAFARRLMGARTMRFGFTPHNAQPAVARFQVAGLEQLLPPAAKECGWK